MVAVIDIGNHNVHLGLYQGQRLRSHVVFPGSDRRCAGKVARILTAESVSGCAIASVVPRMTRSIRTRIRAMTGVQPMLVNHRTARGLRYVYDRPATLGADRIANIVGGIDRYKQNVIVVDCGTAVTLDIGLKTGFHAGGVILPGVHAMFSALSANAVLLKNTRYTRPHRLVGASTGDCMRSGAYYGTLYAIEGVVAALRKTVGRPCLCVATGGWGRIVARHCHSVDRYDRTLTLFGVLRVYTSNVR